MRRGARTAMCVLAGVGVAALAAGGFVRLGGGEDAARPVYLVPGGFLADPADLARHAAAAGEPTPAAGRRVVLHVERNGPDLHVWFATQDLWAEPVPARDWIVMPPAEDAEDIPAI